MPVTENTIFVTASYSSPSQAKLVIETVNATIERGADLQLNFLETIEALGIAANVLQAMKKCRPDPELAAFESATKEEFRNTVLNGLLQGFHSDVSVGIGNAPSPDLTH